MKLSADEAELLAKLRHGVPLTTVSGIGGSSWEVADTDAADATMDEAAAAIERLLAEKRALNEALTPSAGTKAASRAILAERARWKPAVTYFERYCQDEAEDAEHCVCGEQQHEDARAFAAAIRALKSPADQEKP